MGMGSTAVVASSELRLELRPPAAMRTVSDFLRDAAAIVDDDERVVKLEEYVRSLEEERGKIEVFKRELPLCMLILNDVIEGLKDELAQCRSGEANTRPVLEEFMPINGKLEEDGGIKFEKDYKDKMNWMSSAQLWNNNCNNNTNDNNTTNSKKNTKEIAEDAGRRPDNKNPFAEGRNRSRGGAFLPFKGLSSSQLAISRKEKPAATAAVAAPFPDLSSLSPGIKSSHTVSAVSEEERSGGSSSKGSSRVLMPSSVNTQSSLQTPRKARRCWSPELHRRFVSALQQLGGSQVATPKQIRDLMKVDGLTNDEVKSHLQKYRLHTRRRTGVMLGSLWVPQDHYHVSKQGTSQSCSPQGPLQLASAAQGISVMGGDSCEEEDGKSESYNWKGHLQRSSGEETD